MVYYGSKTRCEFDLILRVQLLVKFEGRITLILFMNRQKPAMPHHVSQISLQNNFIFTKDDFGAHIKLFMRRHQ